MKQTCAQELSDTVRRAAPLLRQIPPDQARARPAAGKWCPSEIVGHLIDSASNNHQRFVRAQSRDDLEFEGYDQVEWVRTQCYQDAPWATVVDLWEAFNLHLVHVIEHAPPAALARPRVRHNLDEIAWEVVPRNEPVSLEYFIRDYVGHLKHHLRQIDAGLASEPVRQRGGNGIRSA